jgi:hypothetical protein
MILQRDNFNVPARFTFQPYSVKWSFANAEIVEWVEKPTLRMAFQESAREPEKTWLRVHIGTAIFGGLEALYGVVDSPSCTVLMDRASIPPDVLQPHEDCRSTSDVSGRSFQVLICQMPEFRDSFWKLEPGKATKNAWIMRDEFLNLKADAELGWNWSVCQFLNRWGMWGPDRGFTDDWQSRPFRLMPPSAPQPKLGGDGPDFVMALPHFLKEQQARYRRAVLPSNARYWLRSHPLSLDTEDEFPFFRVRSTCCSNAIEITITIQHLSGFKAGICKWCLNVFEKEKNYKMSYCGRSCANAASVARFREKQRKGKWTAAKIAKVLSQKGATRNAKG